MAGQAPALATSIGPAGVGRRGWSEFVARFPDEAACVAYLEQLRWGYASLAHIRKLTGAA